MQPVYRYHKSPKTLFINLIETFSCLNDCQFCGRPRNKRERETKTNYYEKNMGSLYLEHTPTVEEIITAVKTNIKSTDEIISFTGLGEPLLYLKSLAEAIKRLKILFPEVKTKLITSAVVQTENTIIVKELEDAGLDIIFISLNAINETDYNNLCKPTIKNAFNKVLDLIQHCKNSPIDTYVSFVVGFDKVNINDKTIKDYIDYVEQLGIDKRHIIWRKYRC